MRIFSHLLDYVLPAHCLLCGYTCKPQPYFCEYCKQNLPILPHTCLKCACFLPIAEQICGQCSKEAPAFDKIYTLFPYEFPIIPLIVKLKFQQQLQHAKALATLLIEKIPAWYYQQSLPQVLIPVPLHLLRLQQRGFNQALEIAKPLAKHFKIPLDLHPQRIKSTQAQSGLSSKDRQANVAQAFKITTNYQGIHAAIIDDVVTTGHTVAELSIALKKQGASRIDVWCCARRG